jgi:hypothetical protein
MSLSNIDFITHQNIKIAIIVLFSIIYILLFLVLILFLKVYENNEESTKEIKTSTPKQSRIKNGKRN